MATRQKSKKVSRLINARYDLYEYARNSETNYYQLIKGDSRLPDELRVEPVRAEDKYKPFGVSEFLTSRQVNGVTAFKTGLQKCAKDRNFFSGDMDAINGKKTLVAIAFSKDKTQLRVFVFQGFWIDFPNHRLRSVELFLTNYFHNYHQ